MTNDGQSLTAGITPVSCLSVAGNVVLLQEISRQLVQCQGDPCCDELLHAQVVISDTLELK